MTAADLTVRHELRVSRHHELVVRRSKAATRRAEEGIIGIRYQAKTEDRAN
jgi:hypothetical protein